MLDSARILTLVLVPWFVACASGGGGGSEFEPFVAPTTEELYQQAVSLEGATGLTAMARDWYRIAAEAGSVAAMKRLADIHLNGEGGVPASRAEALPWLQRAAAGGDLDSLYNVGCLHYEGVDGVAEDLAVAADSWQRAAEAGHVLAMGNLGQLYAYGIHVDEDPAQAAHWFRRAAEQGNAYSEVRYGNALRFGQGVEQDAREAVKWLRAAAQQGDPDAQGMLADMAAAGEGMEVDRPFAALMLWRAWQQGGEVYGERFRTLDGELRAQAANDDPVGLRYVGLAAAEGLGVAQDEGEAYRAYRAASKAGDVPSMLEVARRTALGLGVGADDEEAVQLCKKAARRGSAEAQYEYALLFERGDESDDHAGALEWFEKAAAQGHAEAQRWLELEGSRTRALDGDHEAALQLGHIFAQGLGVRRDFPLAEFWFRRSALTSVEGNYELARLYLVGGTRVNLLGATVHAPDRAQAAVHLRECADLGHTRARVELALLLASGDGVPQDLETAAYYAALAEANGDASAVPFVSEQMRAQNSRGYETTLSTPDEGDPIPPAPCGFCGGAGVQLASRGQYIGGNYWPDTYSTCLECNGTGLLYHW